MTRQARRSVTACATILAAAVTLAACGSSSSSSTAGSSGAAASSAATSTATSSPSAPAPSSSNGAGGADVTNYLTYTDGKAGQADSKLAPVYVGWINQQGGHSRSARWPQPEPKRR